MIRIIAIAVLVCVCTFVRAQERVPREACLKIACQLSMDLKQMLDTPIPTDPDIKRVVAVAREQYGALIMPETKLAADTLAKAGKEPVAIGQLWLHKILPLNDGQPVKLDDMRLVNVGQGDQQRTAAQCVLAVRKNAEGKLELLLLSKDKKPLLTLPIKETADAPGEAPIDITAVAQDETAIATLKILGKYEASFTVGRAD